MEFYSPDKDLIENFGKEIKDSEYILELNSICLLSKIAYQNAQFLPHDLLTNWNEIVEIESVGDKNTGDFEFDFRRDILFELENNERLKRFDEHKIFLEILESIDRKLKLKTFIPTELKNEKRWWNCIVFNKGTPEYINQIENDMFNKFNVKLDLKNRIEKI